MRQSSRLEGDEECRGPGYCGTALTPQAGTRDTFTPFGLVPRSVTALLTVAPGAGRKDLGKVNHSKGQVKSQS